MTFKEDDIRPDDLMDGQKQSFKNDIRRLLTRIDEFVAVRCPACGCKESGREFQKYELSYVRCVECDTMYISPRPSPEVVKWYYENSENYRYWCQHVFPASEDSRRKNIFRPRAKRTLELCERYGVNRKRFLEVGSGFGTFCEELRSLNAFDEIIALEPTPDLAESCRKRGLEVIEKFVEELDFEDGSLDVIASFEVIEHLFDPGDFVEHCSRILAPGGLLILTCPNVKGFEISVLMEASLSVDVEHLNYFHPDSLSHLVGRHGFEVVEVTTPGELDAELVRKRILSGDFDASNHLFVRRILIDEWESRGAAFQRYLAENNLSSHMWLVARRG